MPGPFPHASTPSAPTRRGGFLGALERHQLRRASPGVEVNPYAGAPSTRTFEPIAPGNTAIVSGPSALPPLEGAATGLEESGFPPPRPNRPPSLGPLEGPLKGAQTALTRMSDTVQRSPKVEGRLASGDPIKMVQAIKEEGADAIGLNSAPARIYKDAGRDPNADFEAITKAYGLDRGEQEVTLGNLDEDEKSAFLIDIGLKMMAASGAPGAGASSVLGLLGGAALDALGDVRRRRAIRGQQRRELGKIILEERRYQDQAGMERERIQISRDQMVTTDRRERARLAETRRANLAKEKYYQDSLAQGSQGNLSADMQLIKHMEELGYPGLEAVEQARKFKSTSEYGAQNWARKGALEQARAATDAYNESQTELGRVPDSTVAQQLFEETFHRSFSALTGVANKLGFAPPETIEEFLALSGEDQLKFLQSEAFANSSPEYKAQVDNWLGLEVR